MIIYSRVMCTYGDKVVVFQRSLLRSSTGEERDHPQHETRDRKDEWDYHGRRPKPSVLDENHCRVWLKNIYQE